MLYALCTHYTARRPTTIEFIQYKTIYSDLSLNNNPHFLQFHSLYHLMLDVLKNTVPFHHFPFYSDCVVKSIRIDRLCYNEVSIISILLVHLFVAWFFFPSYFVWKIQKNKTPSVNLILVLFFSVYASRSKKPDCFIHIEHTTIFKYKISNLLWTEMVGNSLFRRRASVCACARVFISFIIQQLQFFSR